MRASADSDGLLELQAGFARALLERGEAAPRGLIRSTRFGVYRNNVFASLTAVLRSRYPVIERLVGEEFFKAAAGLFIAAHPPSTPVLIEYGERFPPFSKASIPLAAFLTSPMWLGLNGSGIRPFTRRIANL